MFNFGIQKFFSSFLFFIFLSSFVVQSGPLLTRVENVHTQADIESVAELTSIEHLQLCLHESRSDPKFDYTCLGKLPLKTLKINPVEGISNHTGSSPPLVFSTLPSLPNLESLDIGFHYAGSTCSYGFGKFDLQEFFCKFPLLKSLNLDGWKCMSNQNLFHALAKLPLEELSLVDSASISSISEIAPLGLLSKLKKIDISLNGKFIRYTDHFPEFFDQLAKLKDLEEITSWQGGLPSWFIDTAVYPMLVRLKLGKETVTDIWGNCYGRELHTLNFSEFAPHLRYLELSGYKNLPYLISLGSNQHLEELQIKGAIFDEDDHYAFERMLFPKLRKIGFAYSSSRKLPYHLFAPNLVEVDLNHTNSSGLDVVSLSKLAYLEKINLSNTKITAGAVKNLSKCRSLKVIYLDATNMIGAAFDQLVNLPELETLSLRECDFSKNELEKMYKLTQLKTLDLTDGGHACLSEADFEDLQIALPNTIIVR